MPTIHIQTKVRALLDAMDAAAKLSEPRLTIAEARHDPRRRHLKDMCEARSKVVKAERAVWQYMCRNSEQSIVMTRASVYPERGNCAGLLVVVTRTGPTIPPAGRVLVDACVQMKRTPKRTFKD